MRFITVFIISFLFCPFAYTQVVAEDGNLTESQTNSKAQEKELRKSIRELKKLKRETKKAAKLAKETNDLLDPEESEKQDSLKRSSTQEIYFVGTGDIQRTITESSEFTANTGLGGVFISTRAPELLFESIELDFFVNVASTSDTIFGKLEADTVTNIRNFGAYVLVPQNSSQSTRVNIDAYFGEKSISNPRYRFITRIFSGLSGRFIASNSNWASIDTTSVTSVNVAAFSLRSGIFHDFVPYQIRKEKAYSIKMGIFYSYRGVYGDLSSLANDKLRNRFLGSTQKNFHGLEFNLSFKFENIVAEVSIPIFNSLEQDNQIPGLTNTQLVTSITFIGGFPLKVKQ